MYTLTKKQRIARAQDEAYARDMQEIKSMELASAEAEILDEIEAENKALRTRGGIFEDACGGPLVVSDESTKALARSRVAY